MRLRGFGWATFATLALLAFPLARYTSFHRTVLGRYSLPYFILLCGYFALLLAVAFICLSDEKRYRAVFNSGLAVTVVTLLLGLGAGELAARRVLDNQYRHFPPDRVTRSSTAEYDVEIRTNSRGFRDTGHRRERSAGGRRVAIIGDSFVWGSGVAFEETFASRLDSMLSVEPGARPAEVQNFGVSGIGPVQYVKLFRGAVRSWHPELVIVCFYAGNDVKDALQESVRPSSRWALRILVARALSRPRPAPIRSEGWNSFGGECPAMPENLLRAGRARGVPADSIRARLAAVPAPLVADAQSFRANPFNLAEAVLDPDAIRKNLLLDGEEMTRGWPLVEDALEELDRDVRRTGAQMLLVAIPAGAQIDRKYWAYASAIGFRLAEEMLTSSPAQERLTKFAASRGIAVLDLLPLFRGQAGRTLYHVEDGHWNAAGHELAARAIEERLRQEGY